MEKTAPLPSHFPFQISLDTHRAAHSRTPGAGAWLPLWRIDTSILRESTIHSAPAYGSFFFFF